MPDVLDVAVALESLEREPSRVPALNKLELRPDKHSSKARKKDQTFAHPSAGSLEGEYSVLHLMWYVLAYAGAGAAPPGVNLVDEDYLSGVTAPHASNAEDDDEFESTTGDNDETQVPLMASYTQGQLLTRQAEADGVRAGLDANGARRHVRAIVKRLDFELYDSNVTATEALRRAVLAGLAADEARRNKRTRDDASDGDGGTDSDDSSSDSDTSESSVESRQKAKKSKAKKTKTKASRHARRVRARISRAHRFRAYNLHACTVYVCPCTCACTRLTRAVCPAGGLQV